MSDGNNNRMFNFSISGARSTASLRSHALFDAEYEEPESSPIDIYQDNILTYKKLLGCFVYNTDSEEYTSLASADNKEWIKLSNLLILGFISSVESYVRCMLRRLLLIDKNSKLKSYTKTITYGAATHHDDSLMPEALMEGCSFHSGKNIRDTIKDMTGINLNNKQRYPELDSALTNYDFIGQLRHCIIHRSGHFGSNNALSLGIEEYADFLEKPIKMDIVVIQKAASICDALVKELNDVMFCEALTRTCDNSALVGHEWQGAFEQDEEFFNKYFELFVPLSLIGNRTSCYDDFVTKLGLDRE
ncbi:hypothetical protein AB4188_19300 [Vibrio lentus]